jgi:hypothetical protein
METSTSHSRMGLHGCYRDTLLIWSGTFLLTLASTVISTFCCVTTLRVSHTSRSLVWPYCLLNFMQGSKSKLPWPTSQAVFVFTKQVYVSFCALFGFTCWCLFVWRGCVMWTATWAVLSQHLGKSLGSCQDIPVNYPLSLECYIVPAWSLGEVSIIGAHWGECGCSGH